MTIYDNCLGIALAAEEINELAVERGWWDEPRSFGDVVALIHSELSEALEEYRNGHAVDEVYTTDANPGKPEGVPVELADAMIRIMDYCSHIGINIGAVIAQKHNYNKTRPYRHGGKKL